MRVFVTGGAGYIGSAIVDALVRAGHRVDALVRHAEKAAVVEARGARPVMGDLGQPASFAASAAAADGVIHAAFEFSARGPQIDAAALDALLVASPDRPRFFIYTSGVWVLGNTAGPADETAPLLQPAAISAWRVPHERRVLDAAGSGLRTVVIRPGIVYGGFRGIVGDLLKDAANGLVRIVGSGANHWALVYVRDLGELYVRLAAAGTASGIFHANDEGDERVADLAEAISAHVEVPPSIRHLPMGEARKKMGPYADALALDQIVRSPRAHALGWHPSLRSVAGNVPRLFEEWRRGREAA
jgi:nucleoside-diphosphate-sugar epimerase